MYEHDISAHECWSVCKRLWNYLSNHDDLIFTADRWYEAYSRDHTSSPATSFVLCSGMCFCLHVAPTQEPWEICFLGNGRAVWQWKLTSCHPSALRSVHFLTWPLSFSFYFFLLQSDATCHAENSWNISLEPNIIFIECVPMYMNMHGCVKHDIMM